MVLQDEADPVRLARELLRRWRRGIVFLLVPHHIILLRELRMRFGGGVGIGWELA